ncbi:uncharacterized protein LOC131314130 [Rhododendron vialii]|uniref:uncharacterized protein LOC131314130 n=1 Tax=Rhododendron vialii TaxID=182163 RepID=UPI00265FAF23|nr:uncharacterized protein LOC131314130 [Rhododendron vialii]
MKGVKRFWKAGKLQLKNVGPFKFIGKIGELVTTHIEFWENLSYVVKPEKIVDRKNKVLRNKVIPLVKVWWTNQCGGEATWKTEEDMQKRYPFLFSDQGFYFRNSSRLWVGNLELQQNRICHVLEGFFSPTS